tara:strand:- start:197 stop:715 length:519 start_codon:yes stop_codon:yes gene_type:complete
MKNNPYKLFQSPNVTNNHSTLMEICNNANSIIPPDENYNTFSLTSSSWVMFKIYKELSYYIRSYIGDLDKPLWIQSWLTYHTKGKVTLKTQKFPNMEYYGNICINPQNTYVLFNKKTKLQNKIGQIFLTEVNNSQLKLQPDQSYKNSYIAIEFNITSNADRFLGNDNFYPLI